MLSYNLILFVFPILLIIILLEAILIHRSRRSTFSWKESLASLGVMVGHQISKIIFGMVPIGVYSFIWEHRLWTVSLNRGWAILLLFGGIEFCYYWYHRFAHQIPWLWATHMVHHSTNHFNLSAAYRLGWTGWLSGNFLFFSPLCWLGFHPVAITISLSVNLLYQFWIHTELVPKLGWLEWILNTPSHHRVHHAANPEYVGRNYGGVLVIFDRMFGTFAVEHPHRPLIYGLTYPLQSHNPVTIALHGWSRLFQELKVVKTWDARCRVIAYRRPSPIGHRFPLD